MSQNKLYIGNLSYSVTSQELGDFLSQHWQISDCRVIEGKGFGFATFVDDETAMAAKEALNNLELKGRAFRVDFAKEERPREFSGNRGGGGGGGRGGFGGGRGGGGGGRGGSGGGRDSRGGGRGRDRY